MNAAAMYMLHVQPSIPSILQANEMYLSESANHGGSGHSSRHMGHTAHI